MAVVRKETNRAVFLNIVFHKSHLPICWNPIDVRNVQNKVMDEVNNINEHFGQWEKVKEIRLTPKMNCFLNLKVYLMAIFLDGKIGSFLHVLEPKEVNYLQDFTLKSRLKIPLIIGIDAIHERTLKGNSRYSTLKCCHALSHG